MRGTGGGGGCNQPCLVRRTVRGGGREHGDLTCLV